MILPAPSRNISAGSQDVCISAQWLINIFCKGVLLSCQPVSVVGPIGALHNYQAKCRRISKATPEWRVSFSCWKCMKVNVRFHPRFCAIMESTVAIRSNRSDEIVL